MYHIVSLLLHDNIATLTVHTPLMLSANRLLDIYDSSSCTTTSVMPTRVRLLITLQWFMRSLSKDMRKGEGVYSQVVY